MVSGRSPEMRQLQIWLLSYPGGEVRRVTNDLSSYVGLSLTADGQTLASVQGERLVNIWAAPGADADRARRVTTEAGRDEGLGGLAWTPDGRVVYAARAGDGSRHLGRRRGRAREPATDGERTRQPLALRHARRAPRRLRLHPHGPRTALAHGHRRRQPRPVDRRRPAWRSSRVARRTAGGSFTTSPSGACAPSGRSLSTAARPSG